ncbi:MAG: glycosyltransferase [Chitinispirillaceae bacterium]|nr:glycosyltransferase [Chitinispirillaceae bacterium]
MTQTGKERRILVLAPDLPYPCIGGGRTRMASILDALGSLATVRVAARASSLPPATAAWGERNGCPIIVIETNRGALLRRIVTKLRQIVTGDWQAWDGRERRLLDRVFQDFKPDLVWVEAGYQIRYALRWRDRAPVVVDFWGTSEGAERVLPRTRGWARLWHRYHCVMARNNEKRQVPLMTAAVVVSDHLAGRLRHQAPNAAVFTVPVARIDRTVDNRPLPGRAADTIVVSGVMSFGPNVDAACWFVKEIVPLIRRRKGTVRVLLAGTSPAPEIAALDVRGIVEVTGAVDDLQELVAAASVYALPMRLGSGIRTKLLDVFPTGTPIVTTTIGAEGFGLRDGENALFADDAETFAQACVRLLDEPGLARKIGSAARRLSEEVYTQENVRRRVATVLEHCFGPAEGGTR